MVVLDGSKLVKNKAMKYKMPIFKRSLSKKIILFKLSKKVFRFQEKQMSQELILNLNVIKFIQNTKSGLFDKLLKPLLVEEIQ